MLVVNFFLENRKNDDGSKEDTLGRKYPRNKMKLEIETRGIKTLIVIIIMINISILKRD